MRLLQRFLAVAALCAARPSLGQQPVTFNEVAALPAPPPTHRITYGPGPLQFGNLRLPPGRGPHPVVLFIHGGCYLSRYTISHVAALEQALADSGYAVWSVEFIAWPPWDRVSSGKSRVDSPTSPRDPALHHGRSTSPRSRPDSFIWWRSSVRKQPRNPNSFRDHSPLRALDELRRSRAGSVGRRSRAAGSLRPSRRKHPHDHRPRAVARCRAGAGSTSSSRTTPR